MKTHSRGDETWRCDACGAFNDEPLQVCNECKAARLEDPSLARSTKIKGATKPPKPKNAKRTVRGKARKKKAAKAKDVDTLENDAPTLGSIDERSPVIDSVIEGPPFTEPEQPKPIGTDDSLNEGGQERDSVESREDFIISEPADSAAQSEEPAQLEPAESTPEAFSQPEVGIPLGDHLSLIYVNIPVPELVKRKIDIDFDSFPVISIGRSPENVVVIPDAGVSRTHAELSREGDRVMVKDLQSSNGTYIYDGKEFQKVEGMAEIRANSLVKLGTGTILRLVSE